MIRTDYRSTRFCRLSKHLLVERCYGYRSTLPWKPAREQRNEQGELAGVRGCTHAGTDYCKLAVVLN